MVFQKTLEYEELKEELEEQKKINSFDDKINEMNNTIQDLKHKLSQYEKPEEVIVETDPPQKTETLETTTPVIVPPTHPQPQQSSLIKSVWYTMMGYQ